MFIAALGVCGADESVWISTLAVEDAPACRTRATLQLTLLGCVYILECGMTRAEAMQRLIGHSVQHLHFVSGKSVKTQEQPSSQKHLRARNKDHTITGGCANVSLHMKFNMRDLAFRYVYQEERERKKNILKVEMWCCVSIKTVLTSHMI